MEPTSVADGTRTQVDAGPGFLRALLFHRFDLPAFHIPALLLVVMVFVSSMIMSRCVDVGPTMISTTDPNHQALLVAEAFHSYKACRMWKDEELCRATAIDRMLYSKFEPHFWRKDVRANAEPRHAP